jgi:hypothetical protein
MIEFLGQYGDLNPDLLFRGTDRSGFKVPPGATQQAPVINDPLAMHELLDADLVAGHARGGDHRLAADDVSAHRRHGSHPYGLCASRLDSVIRYGAAVTRIRQSDTGVTVTYKRWLRRQKKTIEADYCICAMPLTISAHPRRRLRRRRFARSSTSGVRLRLQNCVGGAALLGEGSEYLRRHLLAGTSAMAMLVFRNGAGEPDVTCRSVPSRKRARSTRRGRCRARPSRGRQSCASGRRRPAPPAKPRGQ